MERMVVPKQFMEAIDGGYGGWSMVVPSLAVKC